MDCARRKGEIVNELAKVIHPITGGNPGALRVCCELINQSRSESDALSILIILASLELGGEGIWMLYKDECRQDIDKFRGAIISRATEKFLNQEDLCSGNFTD